MNITESSFEEIVDSIDPVLPRERYSFKYNVSSPELGVDMIAFGENPEDACVKAAERYGIPVEGIVARRVEDVQFLRFRLR